MATGVPALAGTLQSPPLSRANTTRLLVPQLAPKMIVVAHSVVAAPPPMGLLQRTVGPEAH